MLVEALALDAFRENDVRRLDMDEDARIIHLRRRVQLHEPPDAREPVIAVTLRCARVAERLARAMNHAIAHAPGLDRVGPVLRKKHPAIKIFAVEKFHVVRLLRRRRLASGYEKQRDGQCAGK